MRRRSSTTQRKSTWPRACWLRGWIDWRLPRNFGARRINHPISKSDSLNANWVIYASGTELVFPNARILPLLKGDDVRSIGLFSLLVFLILSGCNAQPAKPAQPD